MGAQDRLQTGTMPQCCWLADSPVSRDAVPSKHSLAPPHPAAATSPKLAQPGCAQQEDGCAAPLAGGHHSLCPLQQWGCREGVRARLQRLSGSGLLADKTGGMQDCIPAFSSTRERKIPKSERDSNTGSRRQQCQMQQSRMCLYAPSALSCRPSTSVPEKRSSPGSVSTRWYARLLGSARRGTLWGAALEGTAARRGAPSLLLPLRQV